MNLQDMSNQDLLDDQFNAGYNNQIARADIIEAELLRRYDELEKEVERLKDPQIEELHYVNGNIDLIGSHPIIKIMAEECARFLSLNDAENFVSISLCDKEGKQYDLVIKRAEGKTTSMVLDELRSQLAAANRAVEAMEKIKDSYIKWSYGNLGDGGFISVICKIIQDCEVVK